MNLNKSIRILEYIRMIDLNFINKKKINFNKKKTNYYVNYDNKSFEFYIKDTINIFPITNYGNKYNLVIKINDDIKQIIEDIENKFLVQHNIEKKNYIPIIKTNDKGNIIKLKIMYRMNKLILDCYNKDKQNILYSDIQKNTNIKCLVKISNFWNYNNKYGLLIYLKKINLK